MGFSPSQALAGVWEAAVSLAGGQVGALSFSASILYIKLVRFVIYAITLNHVTATLF
jgi:hypothetical protein